MSVCSDFFLTKEFINETNFVTLCIPVNKRDALNISKGHNGYKISAF